MSEARISLLVVTSRSWRMTNLILGILGLPRVWLRRLRCRHELSTLTPAQLRDTGLDPETVRLESRKPFWRA
jgi:uncharacterized protein YjiS (DUF1127 family)